MSEVNYPICVIIISTQSPGLIKVQNYIFFKAIYTVWLQANLKNTESHYNLTVKCLSYVCYHWVIRKPKILVKFCSDSVHSSKVTLVVDPFCVFSGIFFWELGQVPLRFWRQIILFQHFSSFRIYFCQNPILSADNSRSISAFSPLSGFWIISRDAQALLLDPHSGITPFGIKELYGVLTSPKLPVYLTWRDIEESRW